MAGATLTTYDPIFKETYLGPLRDALNSSTVLLKRIKRKQDTFGDCAVVPIRYQRNTGVGARSEEGVLPDAGAQGYVRCLPPLKGLYGRIKVTGRVIAAARSDAGAFLRAVDAEMKGIEQDFKRDINRQLYRSGSGLLAICGTTAASTTVTLATGTDMRWFEVGMHIDILTVTTGAVVIADATISAISGVTITIGTAVTTASTHGVYRHGTRNIELMGLDGIINTANPDDVDATSTGVGSLQSLAVATYTFWVSTVTSNSGTAGTNAALQLHKIQQCLDDVDIASGDQPSIGLCYHRVRQELFKLLVNDRRFMGTMELDGGFTAIKYSTVDKTIPIVVDRDCYPKTTLYFPNEEYLAFFRQSDFDWMDQDGAVLARVPDEDAYEATLFVYMELVTYMRNKHGRLNDISVDS